MERKMCVMIGRMVAGRKVRMSRCGTTVWVARPMDAPPAPASQSGTIKRCAGHRRGVAIGSPLHTLSTWRESETDGSGAGLVCSFTK
jgi:hypothetical protein